MLIHLKHPSYFSSKNHYHVLLFRFILFDCIPRILVSSEAHTVLIISIVTKIHQDKARESLFIPVQLRFLNLADN